jgi:malate synthase
MAMTTAAGISIAGPPAERAADVLTPDALGFVARLQREFEPRRRALLDARAERWGRLKAGELPEFLPATREARESEWRVPEAPADLRERRVEITGPVDRKMVINALNSGASVFMADFEDANSPTWQNVVDGQGNLVDAVARTISLDTGSKRYSLNEKTATLVVRPRGWHLVEKHALLDGAPVSASLFDFGLYAFHCGRAQLEAGSGPYFYLPKLESHLEARLWHEVFSLAEEQLGLGRGAIRATVLIETILAAFEMEEILHELGEHAAGLNAGRWDYIFSVIKKLGHREEFLLPDRGEVTMAVPFMRVYTDLLVRTCHRHGAHAIGGMAAFIPSRRDPEVNEVALAKVREDKQREAGQGFDGTWVAHPDLVPIALPEFERANQLDVLREDVQPNATALLDVRSTPGSTTQGGLQQNVSVGIQYIASWLNGVGAAAISNLMEDAATSEISRSQVWQWLRHGRVSLDEVRESIDAEMEKLGEVPRIDAARELFERVALNDEFVEFLTIPAYEYID